MTGIDVLRRPVGVGRDPSHSVGRPAFRSPAATAAARSAWTSGGGPPDTPRPVSYSDVGRRLRDGWTRDCRLDVEALVREQGDRETEADRFLAQVARTDWDATRAALRRIGAM